MSSFSILTTYLLFVAQGCDAADECNPICRIGMTIACGGCGGGGCGYGRCCAGDGGGGAGGSSMVDQRQVGLRFESEETEIFRFLYTGESWRNM